MRNKILTTIIKMSIPPALSMLIQSLYNLVDSIYITKYDTLAMEALSLIYPIQNIILAIAVGIGVGINAYIATKLGENNLKTAKNTATLGIILSFLHYILVLITGLLTSAFFIKSFTTNNLVINYARIYINLIIIFSFTTIIQITLEKILQSDGKMLMPMVSLLFGAIINIVLDPLLIFTFDLGILGAAIATVVGQIIATIIMIFFVFSKKNRIKPTIKGVKCDLKAIKKIYIVGIPAILISAIPSIMVALMNYILKDISPTAITTFGIYYKLQYFVYMLGSGLSQGVMPLMSFAFGAKNLKRLNLLIKDSIMLSSLIGLISFIIFMIASKFFISMFYDDIILINNTKNLLKIASISFPFGLVCYILTSYFQSIQKPFISLIITVLRQLVLLLLASYILKLFYNETGIYIGLIVSEFITCVICSIMFFYYKNKIIKYN